MRICLIILCCIFLLFSSANSQNTVNINDDERNDEKSEVVNADNENKFANYVKVMRELKIEINELKTAVTQIKLQVNKANEDGDQRVKQLSIELNQTNVQVDALKNEVGKINKVLCELSNSGSKTLKKAPNTKPQLCKDPLDEYYKTEDPDYTWTISDLKTMINQSQWSVDSEVFPLKDYPYGAQLRLTLNDFEYVVHLSYKDINNTGQPLRFKVIPAVIYTYKNQTKSPPSSIIFPNFLSFGSRVKYDVFSYGTMVLDGDKVTNGRILNNEISDTLVIAVHVEPLRLAQYSCSYDGTLTWVVHNYRKMKIPKNNVVVMNYASPNFHTSPTGFRMHVSVYDVGEEDKMKLVASFAILSGPNEDSLGEYSGFNITLTFLHPTDPTKNVVRSESRSIEDTITSVMYLNAEEELDCFWVDDTLYYNVSIIAI